MLRPILFLGCGGSGGKTLRVTRRAITRRLRRAGWTGDVPLAWQFIHIDVPRNQEGGTDDFGPYLPEESYIDLVGMAIEYAGVDTGLVRNFDDGVDRHVAGLEELVGWRPNPTEVHTPIEEGAGQYRAVGRVIAVNSADRIAAAVRRSFNAVSTNAAQNQLRTVNDLIGDQGGNIPSPAIVIVSSLAGGTGAGCFIDVADIVRAECGPAGDHAMALLYTSDVFRNVSGIEGVPGNSLAALSELLAAYWSSDGRRLELLHRQGVQPTPITRGGPSYPFLIGAGNTSGVSLHSQAEVYRAIGEALAMVATAPSVQEALVNWCTANWDQQARAAGDAMGLTPQGAKSGVTSSIGYARLGLGRERFRDYSVKRLARDAAEFLHSGYLVAAQDVWPEQALTPDEALGRTIDFHSERFLEQCGLNERDHQDKKNDQIIDAVRPDALTTAWGRVVSNVLDTIADMPPAEGGVWLARITDASEPLRKGFDLEFEKALLDSTLRWADAMPQRLLDVLAQYVASHGVPVAIGLLNKTIEEMRGVAIQLINQADAIRANSANWMGRVGTVLPRGHNLTANFEHMRSVVREATSAWYYEGEAQVHTKAAALMLEFADAILAPLQRVLRAAQRRLEDDLGPRADGRPSEVLEWPRGDLVPGWLLPSEVEILLDEVDGYPQAFVHLTTRAIGSDVMAEEAGPLTAARRQVISGGFSSAASGDVARALRQEDVVAGTQRRWRPKAAGGTGQTSQFVAELDVASLVRRAEAWLDRPGPFSDHLTEGLADYLASHDRSGAVVEDHRQRLRAFESKLQSALAASAPLIQVEHTVYQQTHSRAMEIAELIEPLPFPIGHPARAVAESVFKPRLSRRGASTEAVSQYFRGDSSSESGSVGIVSYLSIPVHPVVFTSVVGPIAVKYRQHAPGFWQWRRARVLPEAMPIASDVRRAMIRGWYTARLLGMLDTSTRDKPFRVFNRDAGWIPFPFPLLGNVPGNDGLEQLAAVLESIPVAFLGWGVWGDTKPIAAYRRLYHLGLADIKNLGNFVYEQPNPELVTWLETGATPTGCTPQIPPTDGTASRARAAEELLRDVMLQYSEVSAAPLTVDALTRVRRGRDLVGEIVAELDNLAVAVVKSSEPVITF